MERQPAAEQEVPIDLMDRQSDGLSVIMWLVRSTSETYITVDDSKTKPPTHFRIDIPEGHNALDKQHGRFWHPMSYMPETPPVANVTETSGVQDGRGAE